MTPVRGVDAMSKSLKSKRAPVIIPPQTYRAWRDEKHKEVRHAPPLTMSATVSLGQTRFILEAHEFASRVPGLRDKTLILRGYPEGPRQYTVKATVKGYDFLAMAHLGHAHPLRASTGEFGAWTPHFEEIDHYNIDGDGLPAKVRIVTDKLLSGKLDERDLIEFFLEAYFFCGNGKASLSARGPFNSVSSPSRRKIKEPRLDAFGRKGGNQS